MSLPETIHDRPHLQANANHAGRQRNFSRILKIFLIANNDPAYYPIVPIPPPTQATTAACLRAALRADAAAARAHRTGLAALILAPLILALLLRLFGRTEAAWRLSTAHIDAVAPTPHPHFIIVPAIGRAPHAAAIEAGLAPDWILPGTPNRGMNPAATPARPRRVTQPARAPPSACSAPC